MASGGKEGDERHRNADVAHILARTLFPPEPLQHLPRKILDHEYVHQIYRSDLIVIYAACFFVADKLKFALFNANLSINIQLLILMFYIFRG